MMLFVMLFVQSGFASWLCGRSAVVVPLNSHTVVNGIGTVGQSADLLIYVTRDDYSDDGCAPPKEERA